VQNNNFQRDRDLNSSRLQPQPIRVGVVGVGNMGQHHARVLSMLKDRMLMSIAV
jgi:predicted homoserine dehydrogenase-like protein